MARIASATDCPCETRTSTCRSLATASSGRCFLLAISVLLRFKPIPRGGPLQWGRISSAEQRQDLPLTRDEAERILRAPASKWFPLPADWDERIEYLAPALIRLTARIAELSRPTYIGISPEHL